MKQAPSPMPGFNLLVRLSDESNTAATNVKANANPHAYIMYKTKRFRSENDLNAFVVLKAKKVKKKKTKTESTLNYWCFSENRNFRIVNEIDNLPKIKPQIKTDYAQPQKGR